MMPRAATGQPAGILGDHPTTGASERHRNGVLALAARLLQFVVAAERRRREREALADLDDRLLRDVGLTRADVAAIRDTRWWRAWNGLA